MVRGIELAHATGVMGAKRKWTGVDVVDGVEGALRRRVLLPALAAHAVHAFGKAAFFEEALCLAGELPVEERACYRDKNKRGVGGDFRIGGFPAVLAAAGPDISHPLCYFLGGRAACVDEFLAPRVAIGPLLTAALAKKIPVVSPKFFQAESRGIRELQLRPLRGAASGTSLDNVLGAAASGLNHLVVGPATSIDVALTKTDGDIEA